MTVVELSLAIAVLLITPGPTNTLLALAGAERGFAHAMRLIPAELAGYLTTVVPLALLGDTLLSAAPAARPVITGLAALWVAWLALGLWRLPRVHEALQATVTGRRVFVTTLLNPKALIFGLVLLPAGPSLPLAFALFVGQICLVAALWAALGQILRQPGGAPGLPLWLRRLAALWLAIVAAGLAVRALAA